MAGEPSLDRKPTRTPWTGWRRRLLKWLSHPSWQGLGVLIAILAIVVPLVLTGSGGGGTPTSPQPTPPSPAVSPQHRPCSVSPTLSVRLEGNRRTITVTGTCWPPGGQVDIYVDGNLKDVAPQPQPNGQIIAVIELTTTESSPGNHRVVARHNPGDQNASAAYQSP